MGESLNVGKEIEDWRVKFEELNLEGRGSKGSSTE
jgi:hypothetical protein